MTLAHDPLPTGSRVDFGQTGKCPTCGVLSQRTSLTPEAMMAMGLGYAVDRCVACEGLGLWIAEGDKLILVFPYSGVRIPPSDGLDEREVEIYKEAAAIAPMSARAACALVRVLLEAFLKRHLDARGKTTKGKSLALLIDLAVSDLGLSSNLRDGLTAIRKRGNMAVHDPYGLTDDARADELPWLFQAVDSLVDELHTNPRKWSELAN